MPRPEPVPAAPPAGRVSLVVLVSQLRRVISALSEIQRSVQKEVQTVERRPGSDEPSVFAQQRGIRK